MFFWMKVCGGRVLRKISEDKTSMLRMKEQCGCMQHGGHSKGHIRVFCFYTIRLGRNPLRSHALHHTTQTQHSRTQTDRQDNTHRQPDKMTDPFPPCLEPAQHRTNTAKGVRTNAPERRGELPPLHQPRPTAAFDRDGEVILGGGFTSWARRAG